MIPVYRSTVTRLDLSSVLQCMVENSLAGEQSGTDDVLAKECASNMRCDAAMSVRSVEDALATACHMIGAASRNEKHPNTPPGSLSERPVAVFLSALAPLSLYHQMRHIGVRPVLYDVHEELCTEPSAHEMGSIAEVKQQYAYSLFVRCVHFGMRVSRKFFQDKTHKSITVDICATPEIFTQAVQHEESRQNQNFDDGIARQPAAQSPNAPAPEDDTDEGADITIIDCGQNTLFTSGGGAVICVRGKKLARDLRAYKRFVTPLQDINASLALAQLKQFDRFAERARTIANSFIASLKHSRHSVPAACKDPRSLLQILPLMVHSRKKELVTFAHKQGVQCADGFEKSILAYLLETDTERDNRIMAHNESHVRYGNAMAFLSHVVCLPLYPSLDNEEAMQIAKVLGSLP